MGCLRLNLKFREFIFLSIIYFFGPNGLLFIFLYEFGKKVSVYHNQNLRCQNLAQNYKKCSNKGIFFTNHAFGKKSNKKRIKNVKIHFGATGENYKLLRSWLKMYVIFLEINSLNHATFREEPNY